MGVVWLMALGAADGWRTPFMVLLLIVWIGSGVAALIDIFRRPFEHPVNRWLWAIGVVLFPLLGFLIYWLLGKRRTTK